MFVKVREEAKQPVSKRDFWLSVLVVVLLLGFLGVSEIQPDKSLRLSPKLDGAVLAAVWAVTLFQAVRYGWRAFSILHVVFLVCYTLFLGGLVWPHSLLANFWVQSLASLGMLAGLSSRFIELHGKRPVMSSDKSGSDPVV